VKIKLHTAWVLVSDGGFDNSEGILDIENVGKQSIYLPLPKEIIDQIEAFYVAEYRNRMKKAMEAA
jgi:hypothetical protein